MIQHILKLIWNKKKSNALMILEIFLSFMVLFFALAYVFFNTERVNQPLGFETENRWIIYLDAIASKDSIEIITTIENLKRNLENMEEVEGVTFLDVIAPFQNNQWYDGNDDNGFSMNVAIVPADKTFDEVMNVNLLEGRWFNESDLTATYKPLIVNKNFMDEYYPNVSMLDSIIILQGDRKLIGVIDDYRYLGEFDEPRRIAILQEPITKLTSSVIIQLKPNINASFEEKLSKLVNTTTKSNGNVIFSLEQQRVENSREKWLMLISILLICGFLCINVALGLFGVLWYNISKRKSEIGLRQALGAHSSAITKQFILEIMILTGFALAIGIFFAVQIPILKITEYPDILFYKSILYSSGIMLLLVVACALFPALQAAQITPAISLHEE